MEHRRQYLIPTEKILYEKEIMDRQGGYFWGIQRPGFAAWDVQTLSFSC